MLRKRWHWRNRLLAKAVVRCIRLYQLTLSPDRGVLSPWLKWRICAHVPHCSEYGCQAFERYGFVPWLPMTLERVSQCVPSSAPLYDPVSYRIVFFSSAPISIPFLEHLKTDKRFDIVGIVTTSDKPQWRGLKTQDGPLVQFTKKEFPNTYESLLRIPPSLKEDSPKYGAEAKDFHTRLRHRQADFLVVLAYGKIMPQTTLACATIGPINVHGSLLPKYRGASPIQSAILHKETETGITIMHMNEWLDEGDTLAFQKIRLDITTTSADIMELMKKKWPKFLADTLRNYGKKHIHRQSQDDTKATLCGKISKEDGYVDLLDTPFEDLYAAYKAYILWPKVYFFWDALHGRIAHRDKQYLHDEDVAPQPKHSTYKRVILEEISIDKSLYELYKHLPLIASVHKGAWMDNTYTINPCVSSLIVKPEGRKAISWEEFIRGHNQAKVA